MPVTIARAADAKPLNVLGEELRPLTPAGDDGTGLGVAVFDTIAPVVAPGEAGPPPHRHCHFLTITGPGRARKFFECADAEVGTWPPDMDAALAVADRYGVEALPGGFHHCGG
jgi:hypothetical protein